MKTLWRKTLSNAKISGRRSLVKFAVLSDDADLAFFRQRQAQMYAAYHQKVAPLQQFVQVGEITAAKTNTDALVLNVPLDHLMWTRDIAEVADALDRWVEAMAAFSSKHLWIAGTLSVQARKQLETRGWHIHDRDEAEKLL